MTIKPGYIRVSEILSQWNRFENIPKEILSAKAKLGTEVHEAIISENQGFSLPTHGGEGYFESFLKWKNASQAQIIHESRRFYCDKLKITGEVDAIIKFPHSPDLILVDWKTSAIADKLIWPLQGQFYHYLCCINGIELSPTFLFVQLNKEGKFPTVKEFCSSSSTLNVCISAYICYKYLNSLA